MKTNPHAPTDLPVRYRQFLNSESVDIVDIHRLYEVLLHFPDFTRIREHHRDPVIVDRFLSNPSTRESFFGMSTKEEQAYCEWFASHIYKGGGDWIELGTFLGALTKPAVLGLRANGSLAQEKKRVRVFDLFYWDPIMVDCVQGTPFASCCKEGDWYVNFYKAFISDYIDYVEVNQSDLVKMKYSGEPIEFLAVDIMKYEKLVVNVLREFFPHILPGTGYLFHQDYLHFYEGWITLSMYQLREYFQLILELPNSAGVVFRCLDSIPEEALEFPVDSSEISLDWITEAFAWSFSMISEERHDVIAATHVMMLVHSKRIEEAQREFETYTAIYPESLSLRQTMRYARVNLNIDLHRTS